MAILTKTVEVEKSEDRVRKDTGSVIPGWPAYKYEEISGYEGDPRTFVTEVLKADFKGDVELFNAFLTEKINLKRRIDARPGMDALTKLLVKLSKETGVDIEVLRAALPKA